MKKANVAAPSASRFETLSTSLIQWVIHLPRLTRIVLSAVFALAVTLAITPIVDRIYLDNFYSPDTRIVPALITTVVGLAFYVFGWRTIIGYVGETPPARREVFWYCVVGVVACLIVILLTVFGAIFGSME
jgi:hypothetical protein